MKTTLIAVAATLPLMAQEGAPQPPTPEVASVPAAVCTPAQPTHRADKHRHRHHRPQANQQPIVIVVQCPCAGNHGAALAPMPLFFPGAKPEGKPGCGAPAPKPCNADAAGKGLPPFLVPFDVDKDGKLNPEEEQEARKAMKARHEEKMAELREAHQKKMAERRDAFRKRVLEKFDANKDGKLDEQELAAWKAAQRAAWNKMLLDKYDTNKDGKLDEEEKAAMKADWARSTAEYQRSHVKAPRVPVPAPAPEAPAPAPEAPAPAPEAPAPAPEAPAPVTEG